MFCDDFKCSDKYYKCPDYYCIPWRYLCNAEWNCPSGNDEINCVNRTCPGQLKCKNSEICIEIDNLCDSFADCPYFDDTNFCETRLPACPVNCTCLLYSISCININHQDQRSPRPARRAACDNKIDCSGLNTNHTRNTTGQSYSFTPSEQCISQVRAYFFTQVVPSINCCAPET